MVKAYDVKILPPRTLCGLQIILRIHLIAPFPFVVLPIVRPMDGRNLISCRGRIAQQESAAFLRIRLLRMLPNLIKDPLCDKHDASDYSSVQNGSLR